MLGCHLELFSPRRKSTFVSPLSSGLQPPHPRRVLTKLSPSPLQVQLAFLESQRSPASSNFLRLAGGASSEPRLYLCCGGERWGTLCVREDQGRECEEADSVNSHRIHLGIRSSCSQGLADAFCGPKPSFPEENNGRERNSTGLARNGLGVERTASYSAEKPPKHQWTDDRAVKMLDFRRGTF